MKTVYGLIGAGGFGREVMPLVQAQLARELRSETAELYFVVESPVRDAVVNGVPVISLDEFLVKPAPRHFNIAIGRSDARERISRLCEARSAIPFAVTAANAVALAANRIGAGAILAPFSTITANVSVGRYFHLNIYAYVAHDCRIGDFVTFAPGVKCNGNVRVDDHAYIGAGAILLPGQPGVPLVIGAGAVVGMGAVVLRSVPPGVTVVGNPAAIVKAG